jgi:transposase
VKIDEYYTSKKCHRCHGVLGNYNTTTNKHILYDEDAKVPFSKMKICQYCNHKDGHYMRIHRDRNASFNIGLKLVRLLKKQDIPAALKNTKSRSK